MTELQDADLQHDSNCLFCKIIQKKIPAKIVYEDEHALAFEDINAQAPTHFLIIPKQHIPCLADIGPGDAETMTHLFQVLQKLASQEKLLESGFRTVVNSGEAAGQTVFHLHIHLMGGRVFSWPPG